MMCWKSLLIGVLVGVSIGGLTGSTLSNYQIQQRLSQIRSDVSMVSEEVSILRTNVELKSAVDGVFAGALYEHVSQAVSRPASETSKKGERSHEKK